MQGQSHGEHAWYGWGGTQTQEALIRGFSRTKETNETEKKKKRRVETQRTPARAGELSYKNKIAAQTTENKLPGMGRQNGINKSTRAEAGPRDGRETTKRKKSARPSTAQRHPTKKKGSAHKIDTCATPRHDHQRRTTPLALFPTAEGQTGKEKTRTYIHGFVRLDSHRGLSPSPTGRGARIHQTTPTREIETITTHSLTHSL